MTWILLLFFAGLLLLLTEVLVPGGILGVIGGLLLLGASVLSYTEFGPTGGSLAVAAALMFTVLAFYLEFRVLPRTAAGKRAFLSHEIKATSSAYGPEAIDLVGATAESVTVLAPSGYVTIAGKRYEAFCQSGFVPVGTELRVVSADAFRLVVAPVSPS